MAHIKVKRNRQIIALRKKGLSIRQVAKLVGCTHPVVARVEKRGY